MKDLHFDHTCRSINEAMGICEERSDELQGYITFYMVEQSIMREKLFGDDAEHDDVPPNYRTKSAILERCLDVAQDEEERIYITWEFCKLDIKTDHPLLGPPLMMMMSKKAEKFDLDAERFVQWFVKEKAKAKADGDDD